jgi:hypothetical protein
VCNSLAPWHPAFVTASQVVDTPSFQLTREKVSKLRRGALRKLAPETLSWSSPVCVLLMQQPEPASSLSRATSRPRMYFVCPRS